MEKALRIKKIEYETYNNIPYLVLYRKKEKSKTEPCPFCGQRHIHGTGDGHRIAHCYKGHEKITASDGTVLSRRNGYILRTKADI